MSRDLIHSVVCEMAKKVLKKFYTQLSIILPIDDLVHRLYSQDLLSSHHRTELRKLIAKDDKIKYFLDNVLDPSIDIGYTMQFDEMVNLMENSDDSAVKYLVKKIQDFLSRETQGETFTTLLPPETPPFPEAGMQLSCT